MQITNGTIDQYINFYAVDDVFGFNPVTGLTGFTVYYSLNGASLTQKTSPTIAEYHTTNAPGVYALLVDFGTTLSSGNDIEELMIHIAKTGMAPVVRTIDIVRPKITEGYTLSVESDGDLTKVNTLDGHTPQTGDSFVRIGAAGAGLTDLGGMSTAMKAQVKTEAGAALVDYGAVTGTDLAAVDAKVDSILEDTSTTIPGLIGDLNDFDPAADTVAHVTLVDTTTTNTDMRGTDDAVTASDLAAVDSKVDAILVDTGTNLPTQIAALNDLSSSDITAAVPTAIENADALLKRDFASVTGEAARSALNALRFLRNKWGVVGTTLTVTEEDDSTPAWTATVTADAGADPITGSDPA